MNIKDIIQVLNDRKILFTQPNAHKGEGDDDIILTDSGDDIVAFLDFPWVYSTKTTYQMVDGREIRRIGAHYNFSTIRRLKSLLTQHYSPSIIIKQ